MARIPGVDQLNLVDRKLRDITNRLDGVTKVYERWGHQTREISARKRDLAIEIDRVNAAAVTASGAGLARLQGRLADLNVQMSRLPGRLELVTKFVGGKMLGAFDKLGKSIITLGLDAFRLGVNKLENAIIQIYNVHEKWARLMGEFRNRLGVATRNLGTLGKVAAQVEGAIYGLTGTFGQGAPLVAEFVEGLERIQDVADPKNLRELVKTGVFAGRVLGIGAGEAGRLTFALQQMGESVAEQKDLFLDMSAGARAAGVSTAAFGKEIAASRSFLTSFGKEGRRMFVQLATYARQLGVSLKSLEAFTKITDTFDSTAQAVAKLNTVFGTTVSSLDMMLEQDPSKRLETVRQALLAQGKSFDMLSRQERNFLAETMQLSQEELAGVLRTGKTLEEVQLDQERARAEQERSQRNMAKLINKTSTTLFSFAQAWDRVWMAVQKLIRPFTDAIGLTRSGDKDAKSFSQTMKGLFDRFTRFIEEVAANPEWQGFMRRLAGDAVLLARKISEVATGGKLREWIHNVVDAGQNFYDLMTSAFRGMISMGQRLMPIFEFILNHVKGISTGWLALKGLTMAGSLAIGAKGLLGVMGAKGTGGKGVLGRMAGRLGRAALPASALGAAGLAGVGFGNWIRGRIEGAADDRGTTSVIGHKSFSDRATERLRSAQAAGLVLMVKKNLLEERLQAIRQKEMEDVRARSLLEGKGRAETERAVQKVRDYHIRLDSLARETARYVGIKQIENRLERAAVELRRSEAAAKLDAASAKVLASTKGGAFGKQMQELLAKDDLEGAAVAAQGMQARARGRMEDLQRQRTALLRGAESRALTAKERKRLQTLDRSIEMQEKGTKQADEFAKVMRQARDAQRSLLGVTERQVRLENKKIELETILMELRQPGREDVAQAITKYGGAGYALNRSGFARGSSQYQLLLRLATLNQEISGLASGPVPSTRRMQSGGIVTHPLRALIGEAGPEAVIPLRALSRGMGSRQPSKFGGAAAAQLVNFAARGGAPGDRSTTRIVAGDVYLDSRLVGRTLVRSYLENVENG